MFNCFLTALDSTLSVDKEEYLWQPSNIKVNSRRLIERMSKNQVVYRLHFNTSRCEERLWYPK